MLKQIVFKMKLLLFRLIEIVVVIPFLPFIMLEYIIFDTEKISDKVSDLLIYILKEQ